MLKLNLGCGPDYREGWHNVDLSGKCDETVDLSTYPWPWEDGQFEQIVANDILEHMPMCLPFIDECWRVLTSGGRLVVRTPKGDSPYLWIDPTHIRGYEPETFHFFDPTTEYGKYNDHLTPYKWKIISSEVVNYNVCVEMEKI